MRPGSPGFIVRLIALLGLAATCCAQFSGSIQGTVQDPTGAAVPSAKVQLKNTDTNVTTTATSDTEGNYRFISLAPGSYTLMVDDSVLI